MSDLAVEIIRQALTSDKQQHVFASPLGDQAPNHIVMSVALHGVSRKAKVTTRHLRAAWPQAALSLGRQRPWQTISAFTMREKTNRLVDQC